MGVGKKIKERREELGLFQSELAERVGVSQVMINHIEKGRKIPNALLFADIAHELKCTMDDLIDKTA